MHAVSVGEINLLSTLIAEIGRRLPDWECVVSTTTMTGYALARRKYDGLSVFYCPLDFSWAVRVAMRRVRPELLVLAELELWPNLIRAAREHGARVAVVNGRLSERSFRGYARLGELFAHLLRQLDLIAVQNEEYAARFLALGADPARVRVTGSLKFDGAETDRENSVTRELARLAGFREDDLVLLAGSTQEPEEALAMEAFRELRLSHPRLRLVLVPRHPDRFESVARMLGQTGLPWQRRSELDPTDCPTGRSGTGVSPVDHRRDAGATGGWLASRGTDPAARILLVDAVGELGAWWGTAHIGFVGGSLGNRGGQNMIEPAAYGVAVSFGPNTRNFRDIVSALLTADAAVVVRNGLELTAFVRRCLEEPSFAAGLGQRARLLVASQLGATARTGRLLAALVESRQTTARGRNAA
jgi:3-deoxy-D-manno-octulosonic-acid transferase